MSPFSTKCMAFEYLLHAAFVANTICLLCLNPPVRPPLTALAPVICDSPEYTVFVGKEDQFLLVWSGIKVKMSGMRLKPRTVVIVSSRI